MVRAVCGIHIYNQGAQLGEEIKQWDVKILMVRACERAVELDRANDMLPADVCVSPCRADSHGQAPSGQGGGEGVLELSLRVPQAQAAVSERIRALARRDASSKQPSAYTVELPSTYQELTSWQKSNEWIARMDGDDICVWQCGAVRDDDTDIVGTDQEAV